MAKILVQYEADTAQLTSKLQGVEKANNSVAKSAEDAGKKTTNAFKAPTAAASELEKKVKQTGKSLLDSFNEGAIGIGIVGNELDKTAEKAKETENIFGEIGKAIAAAFTIEKILEFGLEAVNVANEAELAFTRLEFAVTSIVGGTKEEVALLVKQSEELSSATFFSPKQIQESQTLQLQFGLTSAQVEKLTAILPDLAVALGTDLEGATQAAIRGIKGQSRELIDAGLIYKDTGSLVGNFNQLIAESSKLEGASTNALNTNSGAVKNNAKNLEILQEQIGKKLSPALASLKQTLLETGDAFANLLFPPSAKDQANKDIEEVKRLLETKFKDSGADIIKDEVKQINEQMALLKKQAADVPFNLDRGRKLEEIKNQYAFLNKSQLALREILLTRQSEEKVASEEALKQAKIELLAKEDLTKLTAKQIQEEIDGLKKRGDASTIEIKDEIDRRQKAIEEVSARDKKAIEERLQLQKDASEQLKQLAERDKQNADINALPDKISQLEEERKQRIKNAEELFSISKKSAEDQKNLEIDRAAVNKDIDAEILKERTKLASDLNALNEKNRKSDLDDTIATIQLLGEKEKQLRIEAFISYADNTKEAQKKLDIDLLEIDRKFLVTQLEEKKKAGESTIGIEKQLTDNAKSQSEARITTVEKEKDETVRIFTEIADATLQLGDQLFNFLATFNDASIQKAEEQKSAQLEKYDAELQALEDLNSKKAISDRVYEQKKAALLEQRAKAEKKADAELKKLKTEQAEADKLKAIFDTIINTSTAVVKFLAQGSIPLSIAAGITGALELATIIAQPIPKFFKGTKFVELNGNKKGIDTVPAMLHEGERVVTASNNKKHWEIYEAIENNQFKKFVEKNYLMPQLRAFKAGQEKEKQKDFAGQLAASFIGGMSGLSYYDADRLRKKGITINNAEEIAGLLASKISDGKPTYYGAW